MRSCQHNEVLSSEQTAHERRGRTLRYTLQSGQGLATVALLNADVNVVLLRPDVGFLEITFLGEGVYKTRSAHQLTRLTPIIRERTEVLEVLKTHTTESCSGGCV